MRQWPISLGRAIDNDLVVDDPHLAPHHAVFELGPAGGAQLRVLPSSVSSSIAVDGVLMAPPCARLAGR